jgi:hypothetical protein
MVRNRYGKLFVKLVVSRRSDLIVEMRKSPSHTPNVTTTLARDSAAKNGSRQGKGKRACTMNPTATRSMM